MNSASGFGDAHHPQTTPTTMDIGGLSSSPPLRATSLPPSSAPQASSNGHGTPRRRRPVADALTFGDEDGDDMPEDEAAPRRRGRARQIINVDVPLVKDAVGESVRESFENFLKTYARIPPERIESDRVSQIHRRNIPSHDSCL